MGTPNYFKFTIWQKLKDIKISLDFTDNFKNKSISWYGRPKDHK